MFKLKRDLVPLSVIICLLATLCFVFAQETLTITTYYPSPYGSYQDLETGNLTFRRSTDGLVHFNYNTTTYNRRLRITAGLNDSGNNDQGASIDLHGNAHANVGRLDLVAGRGSNVTFWSSPVGTDATERMRITDAGNVGIGTIGSAIFRVAIRGSDDTASNFSLFTGGLSSTAFVARNDGNVGIGTTSPGAKLEVYHTDYNGIKVNRGNVGVYSVVLFADSGTERWAIGQEPNTNKLIFRRAAATNDMVIDTAGNVGIGTTTPDPANRLQVNGVIQARTATNATGFEHYDGTIRLYTWLGTAFGATGAWLGTGTPHPLFLFTNDSAPQVTLTTAGNVGIGTTSPGAGLELNSSAATVASFHNTSNVGARLISGATAWSAISDERLKDILGNIENATAKLSSLRTVYFKFKTEGEHNRRAGLIAQDVQKILPEVVDTDSNGYLGIRYTELIPLIIKGFQEQQKEIENLKSEIQQLEAKLKL